MRPGLSSFSTASRWLVTGLILITAVFAPLAKAGAQDSSARFLADYGNVTVMEVTGNFDAINSDGSKNVAPRQAIAKEFFRTHKDEYDFVAIFTNFDFQRPPGAVAYYTSVKNDVQGIGQGLFDYSSSYGSNGKLQGTIDMWNLLKIVNDPLNPRFDFSTDILIHETLHRWGAYAKFKDWNGSVSNALLGYQAAHWSFLFDSGGSTHYGNKWQNNGDGTFTSTAVRKYYSPLDLYLMGMIDKTRVPPTLLIDNPAINPETRPELGATISGTARYVTADDIIAVEGERIPSARDSQKQFKTAFIYAVTPGTFKANDLAGLENLRNAYLTRFSILTDGKGLVQVASTPLDNLPTNPGVNQPSTVPRTLPPNISDGLNWLVNHQQADGSWTDVTLTTERDTAESVATLQIFPTAQSQFLSGLNWLGTNGSTTTDYLARRIEARVHAGNDSTALVQELLARRNSDGGWGGGRNFISSPTDTAQALKALAAAGYSDQAVTGKAVAYLQATQNADGGWSGDTSASVIQPTAAVLSAYNSYRKNFDLEADISKGAVFLAAKQNSDGGFGNSPSTVYDSSLALMALQSLNSDRGVITRGVSYLLGRQTEDGSWNESPFQTALSMRAVWQATVDPDLSIKAQDISIIPATVTALPTNAVLSATIWNLGRSDVSQARVALYEGSIDPGHKLAEQSLAFPGQSPVTVTFSIPVTNAAGHVYYVVADPDNLLKEQNKDNNRAAKALLPEITYDFQVQAGDIAVSPNPVDIGKDVKITVRVTNHGTSDAYNVPVRLYINQPGAPQEIAQLTVDIPAGGSANKEVTWRAGLPGVNLPLTVQIDPNNTFTETSKDNNSATVPLTVNTSTLPNLSVSYKDMVITPRPAREGSSASISVLVKNDGFMAAENVKVNVFKGIASNSGTLLGSQVLPSIPAGQSLRATFDWTGIAESGERIISVQVDPDNAVQEFTKDDNFTFTTLDILSLPDLAITANSITINPATPKSGDQVAITVTVQNAGEQEARDVTVQVKEGGIAIGSAVITLVNGNSQASGTIAYVNAGQTGSHHIDVTIDPDNSITERTKENNSAARTFTIQDANLWLSEPYFSPNNDGIKDSTDFSFRLVAPAKVSVQIINKNGIAVRTFSGGELDNTQGTTITWDGKNDSGSVVDDGAYQIMVINSNSVTLASLPVGVDTNRSPLTEAIGTPYLLSNNLTCQIPSGSFSNWSWLPYDSGILFENVYTQPGFLAGTYQMSPLGDDIWMITTGKWSDSTYDYTKESNSNVSPDGSRIVFVINKHNRISGQNANSLWVQNVNGQGLKPLVENVPGYLFDINWSPDSRNLTFTESISISGNHTLRIVDTDSGNISLVHEGYGWNSAWSTDGASLAFETNAQCDPACHQVNPTLMVYNASSGKRVVYVSPDYENFTIRWLANAKLLLEKGWLTPRLLIVDSLNSGTPIEFASLSSDLALNPQYAVNPNGRNIAFIEQTGNLPDPVTQTVKLVDLSGGIVTVGEIGIAMLTNCEGSCLNTPNMLWSKDGGKLAYVESKYREADNRIDEKLTIYNLGTGLVSSTDIAVLEALAGGYYGNLVAETPRTVLRLVDWLSDENSILLDTVNGYFSLNSSSGSRSNLLPIPANDYWNRQLLSFSSGLKYLTYYLDGVPNEACIDQTGWGTWSLGSLLNLTADLRITKNKSVVKLKGIAADKNFSGYRLEYADSRTPDTWNLIMPPSDVPVLNDTFIDWIPPREGLFHVRLTVWDKAGNEATDRKRVAWGVSTLVIGLYRDNELIAPKNFDNPRQTATLHYTALEAVHLEFSVVNENGDTVRSFTREQTGYAVDSSVWDGRDDNGNLVPDGKYTIKHFDYEFPVEVDNSPPEVSISLGRIVSDLSKLKPSALLNLTELGKSAISAAVTGHVYDKQLKNWKIEYGVGDNPSEWQEYISGQVVVAEKDSGGNVVLPVKDDVFKVNLFPELVFLAGKKLRITAEDYAGNKSSAVSGFLQDQLVWQFGWNEQSPRMITKAALKSYWDFLDKYVLNNIDSRDPVFYVFPDEVQIGSALEITRFPVVTRVLQYFDSKSWVDSSVPVSLTSNDSIQVSVPETEVNKFKAMRFKVTDVTGMEFISNTIVVLPRGEGESGGGSGSGDPDKCDPLIQQCFPDAGNKIGVPFGVIYPEALTCGKSSGEILLPTERLSLVGVKKVDYLAKVGSSLQLLGEVDVELEGPRRVSVDSSLLPSGSYPLSVTVTYKDNSQKQLELGKVVIFDTQAPQAQLNLSATPCPVRSSTLKGTRLGIEINGTVADNIKVAEYALYYGIGENPASWLPAMSMGSDGVATPITGSVAVSGRLGTWDFTDIPGTVFTIRLEVVDAAGNKGCTTSVVRIDREIKINGYNLVPLIFSPNNDGNLDIVKAGFSLDKPATLDLSVYTIVKDAQGSDALGTLQRVVQSGSKFNGGATSSDWDGKGDSGAVLPDNRYGVTLSVTDVCGNTASQWRLVELDTTQPSTSIDYPLPGNPLPTGVMLEIKATATDQHFKSYLLEAGEGDLPAIWKTLATSDKPVSNAVIAAWNTFGLKDRWTLRLSAEDTAGNKKVVSSTIDLGLRKELVKSLDLSTKLISPNNDQKLDTATIAYEVTDACSVRADLLDGNAQIVRTFSAVANVAGSGNFVWDGKNSLGSTVPDGIYTVRLTVSLISNPQIAQTETISLAVDTTPPVITITDLPDKSFLNRMDISIAGSINDANLVGYNMSIAGPSGTTMLDFGTQNRANYTFGRITELVEDTYTLTVDASDLGENQTKLVRAFTIDRTPPKVTLDAPKSGEFYGNSRNVVDISGAIVEKNLELYSLRYGVGETPTDWKEVVSGNSVPTASKLYSWKVGKDDGIADGVYTISLYARDKAGLEGTAKVRLVVDNTPPEVAITMPIDGSYITRATDIRGTLSDANPDKGLLELAEGGCATA
ncbi:MAG: hypothetical protein HY888_13240, partial [Deltaproteobacteria bacterium]|nr:hypothetical protein [Deltaproteobacteria bacterium]